MNKFFSSAVIIFLIATCFIIYYQLRNDHVISQSNNPNRLEQVLESGKLRVSYIVFPPYITRDSSSGKLGGVFYDFVNELGNNLSLEVEWTEEINIGNLSAGFKSNRYDLVATPLWRNASRAKQVDFSIPLFYSSVAAYVRNGDTRFDNNLSAINSPDVTIAAIDGELAGEIAKISYPLAKLDSKPQIVDYSQLLLEVASGKADITFYNELFGNRYMAKNSGKIQKVKTEYPIRLFAETFLLPNGEYEFSSTINAALNELLENGSLERAFLNNGLDPKEYHLRAKPYQEPKLEG